MSIFERQLMERLEDYALRIIVVYNLLRSYAVEAAAGDMPYPAYMSFRAQRGIFGPDALEDPSRSLT